jgi:hypothetical protein
LASRSARPSARVHGYVPLHGTYMEYRHPHVPSDLQQRIDETGHRLLHDDTAQLAHVPDWHV